MEEFQVPEDVAEPSALQVESAGRFCASQDLPSLKRETTTKLNDIVDSVKSRLVDDGDVDALSEQENFDDMFTLVRYVWFSMLVFVLSCTVGALVGCVSLYSLNEAQEA